MYNIIEHINWWYQMDPNGICYAVSNQASDIVVYNGIVQYSKISQADIPE